MFAPGVAIADFTATEIEKLGGILAEKENWFRRCAAGEHRKLEWRAALDFPMPIVAREARNADLIIIGRDEATGDRYSALDIGGAILQVGRPVLIVPDRANSLRAEHVMIGWKDTREARRAVYDALPFLHEAARVTIVQVCEVGDEKMTREHIMDVVHYLMRHRIKADPEVILRDGGSGATQLIQYAHDAGADLLVTGAYGRSRLAEWIFGGMTRDLLYSSPICCLMSH